MDACEPMTFPKDTKTLVLVFLCVILALFAGTLNAAHIHTDGTLKHADCSLCVAAHVTAQPGPAPAPAPAVVPVVLLEQLPPLLHLPGTPETFALFTRPPPAAAPLSA